MNLTRLERSLRAKLSDLLQGYVEHCEVSNHLTARIDFPIYYHGFKFGAPVFTHSVQANPAFITGLIGLNEPGSQLPSDIVLQFIEILTQNPKLAENHVLRILPVANPVALELEADAPSTGGWDILEHLIARFSEQSGDGLLEIATHDSEEFTLEGVATSTLFSFLETTLACFSSHDRTRIPLPDRISLKPLEPGHKWHLRLSVPRSWDSAPRIHGVSLFIAHLIEGITPPANAS